MSSSTVLAGLPLNVLHGARAFGLDTDALLQAAGLRMEELADPEARVSEDKFMTLLEAIERQDRVTDFGLQMGLAFRLETLGAVGYAMSAADNLELAVRTLIRFGRLVHEETMYRCEVTEAGLYFGRVLEPRYAAIRHSTVMSLVGTLVLSRALTGRNDLMPMRVQFQHPRPPEAERYDAVFGTAVEFGSGETAIVLPAWCCALPLVRPDPALFAYLSRHAETLLARLPPRAETLADRVRRLITETLRSGTTTMESIAKRLAMSERTLQRRLQDEGTTFAAIVDETRRALARGYLEDRALAVYEVALLLGYSEPSPFIRAFRRWTGQTPQEFRQADATGRGPASPSPGDDRGARALRSPR